MGLRSHLLNAFHRLSAVEAAPTEQRIPSDASSVDTGRAVNQGTLFTLAQFLEELLQGRLKCRLSLFVLEQRPICAVQLDPHVLHAIFLAPLPYFLRRLCVILDRDEHSDAEDLLQVRNLSLRRSVKEADA